MAMPTARAIRYKSGLSPAQRTSGFPLLSLLLCLRCSNTHCVGPTFLPLAKKEHID